MRRKAPVAVLEGIVDSTNVGAIFRSAAALDLDAVLLTPSCSDPLYRRAARVSMGAVFQVPWTRIGTPGVPMAPSRDGNIEGTGVSNCRHGALQPVPQCG